MCKRIFGLLLETMFQQKQYIFNDIISCCNDDQAETNPLEKDNGFGRDSDTILLDWMTSHGNYNCFQGGNNHSGNSKIKIAGEVAILLTKEGIHH